MRHKTNRKIKDLTFRTRFMNPAPHIKPVALSLILFCLFFSACTASNRPVRDTLGLKLKKEAIENKAAIQKIAHETNRKKYPDHLALARKLTRERFFDVALTQLDAAQKIDPDNPEVYYLKATCLRGKQLYEAAIGQFNTTLALDPQFSYAHAGLGLTHDLTGHHEKALACYAKAISIDPGVPYFYNNAGVSHILSGSPEKSLAFFQKSIALDPGFLRARNNLGLAFGLLGREEKAIKAFTWEQNKARAYNNTGYSLHITGRSKEAETFYQKAIESDADYPAARKNLELLDPGSKPHHQPHNAYTGEKK